MDFRNEFIIQVGITSYELHQSDKPIHDHFLSAAAEILIGNKYSDDIVQEVCAKIQPGPTKFLAAVADTITNTKANIANPI